MHIWVISCFNPLPRISSFPTRRIVTGKLKASYHVSIPFRGLVLFRRGEQGLQCRQANQVSIPFRGLVLFRPS